MRTPQVPPTIRGGPTREVHSIGLQGRIVRRDVAFVCPEPNSQHPAAWLYAEIRPEPVESLFLTFRFRRPWLLLRRIYAVGLWGMLARAYRPLWLRYKGDIDTHQLPPEAAVLLRWRDAAVEITAPGIERTSA